MHMHDLGKPGTIFTRWVGSASNEFREFPWGQDMYGEMTKEQGTEGETMAVSQKHCIFSFLLFNSHQWVCLLLHQMNNDARH